MKLETARPHGARTRRPGRLGGSSIVSGHDEMHDVFRLSLNSLRKPIPAPFLISPHCKPDEAKKHQRPGRQFGHGLRAVHFGGRRGPRSWIVGIRGWRQKTKIMNDLTRVLV